MGDVGIMLDLSNIVNAQLYELILEDKSILHIKAPSYSMVQELEMLTKMQNNADESIKVIGNIVVRIFNRNTDNRTFSLDDIGDMPFQMLQYIITDYLEFFKGDVTKKS